MASPTEGVSRATTTVSDDAVPETDPTGTAGLLAERLAAWKHAVVYLEEFVNAVEKVHKSQAKEYEKILKTISKPLKEGHHFDQSLGGVAGFFENMRVNTEAMVNTNLETEKAIKGTVLPIIERLHKEIKHKTKELSHGAQKSAKDVEKARNATQKYIELLGQQTAAFESTGGKLDPSHDPYVVKRGVLHRLNQQVMDENNHRNDLLAVQNNFQAFEMHVIEVMQQAMDTFNQFVGGQAEKMRALYADMLGAAQQIPPDFEWKGFVQRNRENLIDPNENPRTVDSVTFPNMDHPSTKPLIEGTLERKSRNKLSWGWSTGYYVVTAAKFLHEFKDADNMRKDPVPELSIYLPDAVVGTPNMEKFNVKGKDVAKGIGSKLAGSAELSFKAHTAADADKWFEVLRSVGGATGAQRVNTDVKAVSAAPAAVTSPTTGKETTAAPLATGEAKAQDSGVMGGETVTSPAAMSPTLPKESSTKESAALSPVQASSASPPAVTEGVSPTSVDTEAAKTTVVADQKKAEAV